MKEKTNTLEGQCMTKWKYGHWLFNLLLTFSADQLKKATNGNESEVTIRRSANLFRASTAAMWQASSLPPKVYCEALRPSMKLRNKDKGFSGTANREFCYWKEALKIFLMTIENREVVSVDEKKAVFDFREMYMQDMEQHVGLALSLVGHDTPSLVGEAIQEDMPFDISAVEILRGLMDKRKREFEFIEQWKR